MDKLLSISVAAYNVETMIEQNLQSFVDSGVLDRVEVIVTDDGSKDSTPDIVRRYEEQYPGSIRLVQQKNAGPGSTVNSGIDHATGKYFRMVDGDDWVNPGQLPALIDALEKTNADMVVCNYTLVDHKTGETQPQHLENVPYSQKVPFAEIAGELELEMHNTIFRTSLWKEHDIHIFNCFYTDTQYLLFPIPYVQQVLFLDLDIYQYRVALNGQSMSPASMQRNLPMHDKVLFSHIDLYTRYAADAHANQAVSAFLLRRIKKMAGTQMGTYLSFPPDAEHKAALHEFFARVKQASPAVYAQLGQFSSFKMLQLPGTYKMMSRRFRKANGVD